jgi:DNA-binding NarL/FixJ family response regulator
MVESGEAGTAEASLRQLVEDARAKNRTAELVSLLTWQCICLLETGNVQAARETLKLALAEGRPGGFVRSFLPTTYDLRPFLRRSIRYLGADDATYVRMLVGTSQGGSTSRTITAAPPSPPASPYGPLLSPREVELLREGATNAEIASRLHITLRTTKKHVSNILGKLGLTSRMEAAMWANNVHNT